MVRKAMKRKRSATSPISIGNCKVEIDGKGVDYKSSEGSLVLCVSNGVRITISVDDRTMCMDGRSSGHPLSGTKALCSEGNGFVLEDLSFLTLNPKDIDSHTKSLLQQVLKLYLEQLPSMNYAANTGKESNFLQRCISSGKYKALILRQKTTKGLEEVIAAVSYQIIPADTQFAEIILTAVRSEYQSKGIGHLMFQELSKRLHNVGIGAIYCWADKESEGFWLKQGFVSIGEVDGKGKARRLPVKADIRRALCFPCHSTLMVMHLKKDHIVTSSTQNNKSSSLAISFPKSTRGAPSRMLRTLNRSNSGAQPNIPTNGCMIIEAVRPKLSKKDESLADIQGHEEYGCGPDVGNCSPGGSKRRIWEASLSSLKSKRIRGGHLIDFIPCAYQTPICDSGREIDSAVDDSSLGTPCNPLTGDALQDPNLIDQVGNDPRLTVDDGNNLIANGKYPRIMLMNIADVSKKAWLTKIIEELGGLVTCNGKATTHVITGKARRTLNFCTALCSGAWVVSPGWLKASFREGHFIGESGFILEDQDYLLKYKSELCDSVGRAKANPCSLLNGYGFYLTKHIQPSVNLLSAIIKSAGGNVICGVNNIEYSSQTILLACEEDMEEALAAAKKGVRTFSSDWFMSCVMRQQLDLEAPQFAESL